jgi:hypothetical protein
MSSSRLESPSFLRSKDNPEILEARRILRLPKVMRTLGIPPLQGELLQFTVARGTLGVSVARRILELPEGRRIIGVPGTRGIRELPVG